LELSIAQFWSSGNASHEPTCVDFEVLFINFQYFLISFLWLPS
jgi:hypothetical protein